MTFRSRLGAAPGLIAALLLAACGVTTHVPFAQPAPNPTTPASAPPTALATIESITPTPEPEGYWIQPGVPQSLAGSIQPALQAAGLVPVDTPNAAILRLILNPGADAGRTARWVYAVATPFATIPDDISWAALQGYWRYGSLDGMPAFDSPPRIVLTPDVAALLTGLLGQPAEGLPLQVVDAASLTDTAWSLRPSISLLPFDTLTPRWKVLTLDGQSVLDRALNTDTYPLVVSVGLVGTGQRGAQVVAGLQAQGLWAATNRDPAHITVVVVTGVTALVRATAKEMEIHGVDFPAEKILPFFADADILHTSNEVSFATDCPAPQWTGEPKDFCSPPVDFTLLTDIGLDVVELTGNHNNDWSLAADLHTLDLYDANHIVYFGGGRNLDDATAPRIVTAPDGTRVAFVGCNQPGPFYAFATDESPGAAPCGDWSTITATIRQLKADDQADVVIASVQYVELPRYDPSPEQVTDFEKLAAAGADIVSGSQAHQPQGFAFEDGAFVHYGVGNLFFDQMDFLENRQMFADKHILYNGHHISTVLFTGLNVDYAQPNPMSPEDRAAFLQTIFQASGW